MCRLNAAVIPPEGARQDSETFLRLLAAAGAAVPYTSPSEIFAAIAQEVAAYRGLDAERGASLVGGYEVGDPCAADAIGEGGVRAV